MKNELTNNSKILKGNEVDLRALVHVLWSNKKSLIIITGSFLVVSILYLYVLATPLFQSNASLFQTENDSKSPLNKLSSIASVAGFNIGSPAPSKSIDLVDYVKSRTLKSKIIEKKWDTKNDNVDLITFWKINDTTSVKYYLKSILKTLTGKNNKTELEKKLKWKYRALNKLEERIIPRYTDTGLFRVEVFMEDPKLAQSIVNFILEAIINYTNSVNMESWKKTGEFYIQRLKEIKIELQDAEGTLTKFQKENRRIIDSPDLIIELTNLKRDVEVKSALLISLQNEYEVARIEQTKELSQFKILDKALYPLEISKPKKKFLLLMSLFVGFFASIPCFLIYRNFASK